jgi:hypothetical protein
MHATQTHALPLCTAEEMRGSGPASPGSGAGTSRRALTRLMARGAVRSGQGAALAAGGTSSSMPRSRSARAPTGTDVHALDQTLKDAVHLIKGAAEAYGVPADFGSLDQMSGEQFMQRSLGY